MTYRDNLPHITDHPREAWSNGWWTGICLGFILGIGATIVTYYAVRGL